MEFEYKGACLSYLLLCNKLPPNVAAQNICIYVCMYLCQESRHVLTGFSSQDLSKAAIGVGWAVVISRLNWKGIYFQVHVVGFRFSLALDRGQPQCLAMGVSPTCNLIY